MLHHKMPQLRVIAFRPRATTEQAAVRMMAERPLAPAAAAACSRAEPVHADGSETEAGAIVAEAAAGGDRADQRVR
jgi:hypothetical protein